MSSYTSLHLVRLDQVMAHVVEQAYDDMMKALSENQADQGGEGSSSSASRGLALALASAKQKLSRLDIIMQWASLKWEATVQCARVLAACDEEEHALVAAADQLAYLHSELLHTKTPLFDVSMAYKVLAERDVSSLLPRGLWKEAGVDVVHADTEGEGLGRMMYLLRARVMAEESKVVGNRGKYNIRFDEERGSVLLRANEGLYEAELCLVPAPDVDVVVAKWRLSEAERKDREEHAVHTGNVEHWEREVGERTEERRIQDSSMIERMEVEGAGLEHEPERADQRASDVDEALMKECASKSGFQWRWRVLSVKLLPALDASITRVSSGALAVLGQQIEERLWMLADQQVLEALGLVSGGDNGEYNHVDDDAVGMKEKKNEENKAPSNEGISESIDQRRASSSSKPPTNCSALALVDGRLRAISSHVLVGAVVADVARDLECGTWKGAIKVGRPTGSNGILIDLWCGIPISTKEEAEVLESSDAYEDGREFDPRPCYASFEVLLDAAGTLTPRASPDTICLEEIGKVKQSNRGDERIEHRQGIVASLCSSDGGDGSYNLDRLLLRLTGILASCQLKSVRSSMARQLEAFGNLAVHSSIVYRDASNDDSAYYEPPRIDLVSCDQSILSVTTNLKTGIPLFLLGPSVAEDGLVCRAAQSIVRSANALLKEDIRGLKAIVLPKNASASMYLCSLVAKNALKLCAELVSFVSVRHLIAKSPFRLLKACERTPGMLIDASRYTVCYRHEGNGDWVGFLVLQTDFGVIGLQRAKFVVYDANMMREIRVDSELPFWEDVLNEGKRELSGKKRSRGSSEFSELRSAMTDGQAAALRKLEERLQYR